MRLLPVTFTRLCATFENVMLRMGKLAPVLVLYTASVSSTSTCADAQTCDECVAVLLPPCAWHLVLNQFVQEAASNHTSTISPSHWLRPRSGTCHATQSLAHAASAPHLAIEAVL